MRNLISIGLLAAAVSLLPPAFGQPASKESRDIACGETRLTVFRMPTDETHHVVAIHLMDSKDDLVSPSLFFTGSFHSLCLNDRFLLVSDDVHFGVTKSFLMRGDGTRIAELDLGWGPATQVSEDHAIFWVQTHEGDRVEETRLRVFDSDGDQLLDQRYRAKGVVADVSLNGRVYSINVNDPALPG